MTEILAQVPRNPVLSDYIDYYYFQKSEWLKPWTYTFYPNNRVTISIYQGSKYNYRNGETTILPGKENQLSGILTPLQLLPLQVTQSGPIDKVAIVFKPDKIGFILRHQIGRLSNSPQELPHSLLPSWNQAFNNVFETDKIDEKIKLLDDFFINKIKELEHPLLHLLITKIEGNPSTNIQDLAREFNCSRKSIHRWFQKLVGCSPESYKALIKFRKSIGIWQQESTTKLSDLAGSDFYDQSHFIRLVRKMTGQSPKHFFDNLERVGQSSIFWSSD
ncbi:MAG: helix-turn-helix domain-containing protein [Bacteroidota bacterium]